MARSQLSSAVRASSDVDHELGGRRILQSNVGLPLSLLPDQFRRLLARWTVHRRRNMHYPIDFRRRGSRPALPVTPPGLSSPLCGIGLRLAPTERCRLTLRCSTEGLVLSLEPFDSPQKLPNLSFAVSELPLKLRDLSVLLFFFLAHPTLPTKGYSSFRHTVNRYQKSKVSTRSGARR